MVGLGNRQVTPDALGPYVVDNLHITRHIIEEYGKYATGEDEVWSVSAIVPGVMGQTGMETVEVIRGVVAETKPDILLVIDALAARNSKRLNRTIQIADTGINPGSGVGNHRNAITEKTVGIPVIAIGGLGDWKVNEEKLQGSLGDLISRINALGVKFGLWFEPEMVNEDSDLYREHPDWAIQIPGRKPVKGRNQLLLDFSRKEVVDAVYEQMCQVLDQGNIEYVKWDMNRSMAEVYSMTAEEQGSVQYDYMLGLYDFLERIISRYPDLLIEGCSGGGGRFDAGMLYYTPQIWCSDNTDAVDRVRIQYGTSFGYPVSAVGSHVSAVPNHQTGRKTSLHTRGVCAMAGTFGYELDPAKMTDEERREIRKQIVEYKKYAQLVQNGLYYRLSNPFAEEIGAWEFVSEDGKEVLVNVVMLEIHGNMTVNYVKMKGLCAGQFYKDSNTGKIYPAEALMEVGIPMPLEFGEYKAYQIYLEMVE